MAVNPETVVTKRVRGLIEDAGAHFVKLSDQFTRGVPDSFVATNRLVLIEFKVDKLKTDPKARTYKSLGLKGSQDHHIRQVCRRTNLRCACVITDLKDGGKMRLWIPLFPENEGGGFDLYVLVAYGWKEVAEWLGIRLTSDD